MSNANIHPLFQQILANIAPTDQRFSTRGFRTYLSQADADAYNRGFAAHPETPAGPVMHTPEWDGYFDADERVTARDEEREERAREERDQ
jgi:hypothetical protein